MTDPSAGQVVRGNRWDRLEVPELGAWIPTRRLSVILPHFQAPGALEITLAGLAQQSYPAELIQVVVADDGSSPPLELPARHRGLDVTVVHQEDRGFGLARARNTGAFVADGDILVFLDCDMVPEPTHLEAHARWHHACQHAVTLGFRTHVEFDDIGPDEVDAAARTGSLAPLFDGRPRSEPVWLERHMVRMAELTTDEDDLFRAATGGNLGVRAELFHAVGGFDETFTQWGSEDTDLGHRLFLAGALLVPERRAACWHQGDSRGLEAHERTSLDQQRARISQTVTHRAFRRTAAGRSFLVPRVLARVVVDDEPHAMITATIESVLGSNLHDLEILLQIPDEHPDQIRLRREWAGDPRVVDAERPDHRRTPHRVELPVGVAVEPHALDAVIAVMTNAAEPSGLLHVTLDGSDLEVLVLSTRALARARLVRVADGTAEDDEQAIAGELFGERTLAGQELGMRWSPVTELPGVRRPVIHPSSRTAGASATAATPATPATAATSAAAGSRSRVGPWLLIDTPLGWLHRGKVGELLADADRKVTEAQQETVTSRHETVVARYERDRLYGRRAVRVAKELADTAGGRSARTLPARLRAANERLEPVVPPPAAPEIVEPETEAQRGIEAAQERGLLPPRPVRAASFPHLRVLHLGAAGRFLPLAAHTAIDPEAWREQLRDGADLVLLEPPADAASWDPLGGDLPALLRAATELGIPSVRLGTTSTQDGPGRPTLELVEGVVGEEGSIDDDSTRSAADRTGDRIAPSVDTATFNPTGWRSQPPDPVVAVLGRAPDGDARELLASFDPPVVLVHPPDLRSIGEQLGIRRYARSPQALQRALVRAGVLLDHPSWRGDAAETLRTWTAALACGTPVVVVDEAGPDAEVLSLPDGEHLPVPPGVVVIRPGDAIETVHRLLVDPDLRERHGIVGRRWALDAGSRETALRTILDHLDVPVPPPPRTTVLLATNRPDFLDRGLANVARQSQPGVDVSLVLHGSAFDGIDVPDRDGLVSSVTRAPDAWLLGDCLNAALDRAGGELVTKMDDDDHYGPEHLRDLAAAWAYSGADLVGKRVEYVHLVQRGITLRRPTSPPERDRPHVGGPTLFGSRATLRRHRFLRVPNRVDSTLYERVLADGGRIYGIHSRDLILERHGDDHAWHADDEEFLADAIDQRDGLAIDLATSDPRTGT